MNQSECDSDLYARVEKLCGYVTNTAFYKANGQAVDEAFFCIGEIYKELPPERRLAFDEYLNAMKREQDIRACIYLESFQLAFLEEPEELSSKLRTICEWAVSEGLTPLERYYIGFQAVARAFRDSRLSLPWGLIEQIRTDVVDYLKKEASKQMPIEPIPQAERDEGLVVVLTSQLLGLGHGPSKTALDRCLTLRRMNKNVKLICTREMGALSGMVPFYSFIVPNIKREYSALDSYSYEGMDIAFHQCRKDMPNSEETIEILQYIKEAKPCLIVSIGDSLVAELADGLVPVVTVATVSGIPAARTTFRALYRPLMPEERAGMVARGDDPESVLESVFTFKRLVVERELTRAELGLPEGKRLLLVVGARLDFEVTNDFLDCVLGTATAGTHLVFMGIFASYKEKCQKNPLLARHSSFIGFRKDVAAVNRICWLYANPRRQGGGGSAVEAMCEGLPVVTLDYGDCAACTGNDFTVRDFTEMREVILRYGEDRAFYDEMSEKARKRADELTDTDRHFRDVIEKALHSRLYW